MSGDDHAQNVSCLHRELYTQFLKEMIIQPGIAKANLGLSREDVTLEDHVSSAWPTLPPCDMHPLTPSAVTEGRGSVEGRIR